jgi:hypothetical protein
VVSEHHVVPPPAEFGTRLQPRHVPVLVSHQGAAELVSQSLSLRHCTQRPLVRLHTCPVGHVPFMQPWHWKTPFALRRQSGVAEPAVQPVSSAGLQMLQRSLLMQ